MNRLLLCGAVLGLVSVIMGALGDHALALAPEKTGSLETAIRYNMLYAVLIVVLAMAPAEKKLRVPGFIFTLGTILFSFGIYAAVITGLEPLTYLTPFGGLTIIMGWAALIRTALATREPRF